MSPNLLLLKSAVAKARRLTSVCVLVDPQDARFLRALRVAPSLTDLHLRPAEEDGQVQGQPFGDLAWCLPPTLRSLSLNDFDASEEAAPRSALKAFFQRTPLLRELHTSWMLLAPLIQGMLDAGVEALPMLRHVECANLWKDGLTAPLLRRFLHRFPKVHVDLFLPENNALELDEYQFIATFSDWPRVSVDPMPSNGPPSPHASDDESGSDVEAASDHGSDSEEPED